MADIGEVFAARHRDLEARRAELDVEKAELERRYFVLSGQLSELEHLRDVIDPDFAEVKDGTATSVERAPRRDVRGDVRAWFAEHRGPASRESLSAALMVTVRSAETAIGYLSKRNEIVESHGRWWLAGSIKISISAPETESEKSAEPAPPEPNGHDAGKANGHVPEVPEPARAVSAREVDRLLDTLAAWTGPGMTLLQFKSRGIDEGVVEAALQAHRIEELPLGQDGFTIYAITPAG